jgi:hypothetical protein
MAIRKRPLREYPRDTRALGKFTRSLEVDVSGSEVTLVDDDIPDSIARDSEVTAAVAAEAAARDLAIAAAVAHPQTAAEAAASVTPASYAYDTTDYYDIRRHGGVIGDSAAFEAGNNAALASLLAVLDVSGEWGQFPQGVFRYSVGPTFTAATQHKGAFKLRGHYIKDYGTAAASGADARGSILKYTGNSHALKIEGASSFPIHVSLEGLCLLGTSLATRGLILDKGTFFNLYNCGFLGFTATNARGLEVKPSAGVANFTGALWLQESVFGYNYEALATPTAGVNIFNILGSQFHTNVNDIVLGTSGMTAANAAESRSPNVAYCHFEGTTTGPCIKGYGGLLSPAICFNYFEPLGSNTSPIIDLGWNGLTTINEAVLINSNLLSRALAVGEKYINLESVRDAFIHSNRTITPIASDGGGTGVLTDRYFVTADAACSSLDIRLPSVVSGATPLPIRVNGVNYTRDYFSRSVDFRGTDLLRNGISLVTKDPTALIHSGNYTYTDADMGVDRFTVNGDNTGITHTIAPSLTGTVATTFNDCNASMTLARGVGVALIDVATGSDADVTIPARGVAVWTRTAANRYIVRIN